MRHKEETHKAIKPKYTCARIYKGGPPNLVGSCELAFPFGWVGLTSIFRWEEVAWSQREATEMWVTRVTVPKPPDRLSFGRSSTMEKEG